LWPSNTDLLTLLASTPSRRTTGRLLAWLPLPGGPWHTGVEVLIESGVGLALMKVRLRVDGAAEPVLGGVQTITLGDVQLRRVEASRLSGVVAHRADSGRKQEQHKAACQ